MAVEKVSVSLPAELVSEARQRVGTGGLSALVADSLERRLRMLRLADAVSAFEREHGSISAEDRARADEWLSE